MIDDFQRPVSKPQPRTRYDTLIAPLPDRKEALNQVGSPRPFPHSDNIFNRPAHASQNIENNEPLFLPPEQLADSQPVSDSTLTSGNPEKTVQTGPWWRRLDPRRLSRKQATILACVAVCLLAGGTAFALSYHKPKVVEQKVAAVPPVTPAPTPKPIVSPLSGMAVTSDKTTLPVTGVMIENSSDARPQSGLDQAGVVFEAIAEAGITRFLALYQENSPAVLGPVRSARPYFVEWADTFNAGYAHVGGSPDGLQRIKDLGVRDLDQFYNAGAYHRITSRYAPHNMYTSMDALVSLEKAKGYTSSTFTSFTRAAKEAPSAAPSAKSIDFNISSSFYNVHYDYDAASNSYKRSEGGSPHVDNETKQQLSPKVVIALAMPYSLMPDGYHSMYNSVGTGQMLLFQNGAVTPGTWSKAGPNSQFEFKDNSGKAMELNPGQTWISVVSDISKATYHP